LSWTFRVVGQEGAVEVALADVGGVARARASSPCWASLQGGALGRAWPVCGYARVGRTPLLCSKRGMPLTCFSRLPRCLRVGVGVANSRPGYPVGSLLMGVVANDRHSPFIACIGRGAAGSRKSVWGKVVTHAFWQRWMLSQLRGRKPSRLDDLGAVGLGFGTAFASSLELACLFCI
jgi:hypothetical protein